MPERLGMEVHVHAILLAEAQKQVARHPDLVRGPLRAFPEDLELPLALGNLGVDPLVIDARLETEVEVGIHDLAGDVADVLVTHAGVVLALRGREPLAREAQRGTIAVEEVLLLETEPRLGVVGDRGAAVAQVRRLVGQEHLAHDQDAVAPCRVGIRGDRLQQAVRVDALRLARRASVEAPDRELLEARQAAELLHLRLAAEMRDGLVAVEPDVFELVLAHRSSRVFAVAPGRRGREANCSAATGSVD
jgi:hypothetical protein